MVLEQPMKLFFMYLSKNKAMNKAAKQWGLKFGASQVVAGQSVESAIEKVKELNEKGLVCTLDHLGEFVDSREEALEATEYCIKTLEAIAASGANCNLSLKMTQLGLDISDEFCLENMRRIVQTAKDYNNFVRIDMEDHSHCQQTLDILAALRKEFDNVGTVIQAYLFRAEQDIADLKGISLRLVKGAYKESAEVAYQDKNQVDANYLNIIKKHLQSGSYTAIATHDHQIIAEVKKFTKENNIPQSQFEFQMLYGFRTNLQLELVKEGYTTRVYVPFGQDWFGYFMRRMAERPQNVSFALRGLISK
ncbi:MAG: proline dehydrogenase [Bacillaceae bacterium]|uniref:proline dehydrogenase n=1 Tax=Alkalihalobacterium chitinilyticum TaxID=2980103 RepID=A0ABT5VLL9_9BACI|nr:proline dehydrogenase [Alkalihalobacterium chitinilyticum]MDE5416333.1 proline dehydrogenase [Alkalihalobacterium chitinilyticum]MEB1809299.1 proline dehydrogenase [Bacillaceae bacterium]